MPKCLKPSRKVLLIQLFVLVASATFGINTILRRTLVPTTETARNNTSITTRAIESVSYTASRHLSNTAPPGETFISPDLILDRSENTKTRPRSALIKTPLQTTKPGSDHPLTHSEDHVEDVNPHPSKYLLSPQDLCEQQEPFLLVYVHSAPANSRNRLIIRRTWGNSTFYPQFVTRFIFVLGYTTNKKVQNSLKKEYSTFKDIVQGDFMDSYRNMTRKAVEALQWISTYCNMTKFILKSDDDMYVNMFSLLRHLSKLPSHDSTNAILCLIWPHMVVDRKGKWKVPVEAYPDSHYPPYCSGSAFTMSGDVAQTLLQASRHVTHYWIDDVYITGILTKESGIRLVQFQSAYTLKRAPVHEKLFTGRDWASHMFWQLATINMLPQLWNKILALENSGFSNNGTVTRKA